MRAADGGFWSLAIGIGRLSIPCVFPDSPCCPSSAGCCCGASPSTRRCSSWGHGSCFMFIGFVVGS